MSAPSAIKPGIPNAALRVVTVPAFDDNYLWLIHDGVHAAVIDPGDAAPIFAALDTHRLTLTAILLTHHHADHIGGVPDLLQQYTQVPVYGPAAGETIATITRPLREGDLVHLAELSLALRVIEVPGHTKGHLAYYAAPWLFCGDTLFAGGCGRLFSGSAAQMAASLTRLAALPGDTQVYCAHEYTLSNLRFAHEIEPDNADLNARIVTEQARRARHEPTVPSTIDLEIRTNPFLRCREKTVLARLQEAGRLPLASDPVAIFAALREWKDNYR